MEFPKFALLLRCNGSLGRLDSEFVVAKRKMLKYDFYLLWVLLEHLLEYRHQPGAVRSLKVTEYGNGNRGILGTLKRGPLYGDIFR